MNDEGQLYTIEGIAAAALILTTVYLVLNSTMVFTPGDTHVYDMQLEQLGNDVLAVMDQRSFTGTDTQSLLESYVERNQPCNFYQDFRLYSSTTTGDSDNIQFIATIYYYDGDSVERISFEPDASCPEQLDEYHREKAVVVTRWVNIEDGSSFGGESRPQTVLLEVQLWRG